ncbi:MAG: hypothetical protein H8E03_01135 [Pelagibacteraceae bacterium]|nr:hypothetical protein [Pelagibacteraceae bacterium]
MNRINHNNRKLSKFKFFPSFSIGGFGDLLRKDFRFKNGLTCRFYADDFPEKFRHNEFLISGGALYKGHPDARSEMGLSDTNFVMGDSGGFQFATGAMKWKPEHKIPIFAWLEKNSDVAMNLDIPPRFKYQGKFDECLQISKDNYKYFADNQSSTEYLNVVHGDDEFSYKKWYDEVKQFPFQGWAIGGGSASIRKFMSGFSVLLDGKEHLNPAVKYLHILGTARIDYFLLLLTIQKTFDEMGIDITVTTDCSSPDRGVVFGAYYVGVNLKRGTWESITFPNEKFHGAEIPVYNNLQDPTFPYCTEFDEILAKQVDFTDMKQKTGSEGTYTCGMRIHNFMLYKDVLSRLEHLVYGHDYILKSVINNDTYELLTSVKELIRSDNPMSILTKYQALYSRISGTSPTKEFKAHEFF